MKDAIDQFGLRYPVVQDNEMGTWNAYGNEYWPADYLIDAQGHVRYATAGEGDYSQTETAIRALLAEAGATVGGMSHPTDVVTPSEVATPETYLGTNRAQGWRNGPQSGVHDYGASTRPIWRSTNSTTAARGASPHSLRRLYQVPAHPGSTWSSRPRTYISC